MIEQLAAILMGSPSDKEFVDKITSMLDRFGVAHESKISSAHKSTTELLEIVKSYDVMDKEVVYIAVAGMSNALCGVLDGNTARPVITCSPTLNQLNAVDIYSALRMPKGIGCTVVVAPEAAAVAAAKIFALNNQSVKEKLEQYKTELREKINKANE